MSLCLSPVYVRDLWWATLDAQKSENQAGRCFPFIVKAVWVVQDGGSAFFAQTMVKFLKSAEDAVAELRAQSADTMEQLRNLYAYFGERYDGNDPVKILGTLASFLDLYAKSVKQYRVRSFSWPLLLHSLHLNEFYIHGEFPTSTLELSLSMPGCSSA